MDACGGNVIVLQYQAYLLIGVAMKLRHAIFDVELGEAPRMFLVIAECWMGDLTLDVARTSDATAVVCRPSELRALIELRRRDNYAVIWYPQRGNSRE